MRIDEGYCLVGPSNQMYADTFSVDKDQAWGLAFEKLYADKKWMAPYWKQWDASIKAARERGWSVEKAKLHFA